MLPAKLIEISHLPSVDKSLTNIEKLVLRQSNKMVRDMNDMELRKDIGSMVPYICKDVGITNVDEYYATRFMQLIKRYFSELSQDDIKLAFELTMVGQLDEFLPKNRGEADRNHYSRFSPEYISKILNAYMLYKNKVKVKVVNNTPAEDASDEKKESLYYDYIEIADKKLAEYKATKCDPKFIYPEGILNLFYGLKITRSVPIQDFNEEESFSEFLRSDVSPDKKKQAIVKKNNGHVGTLVKVYSDNKFYIKKIVEVFDYLIAKGKTVSDYSPKKPE